MTQPCIHCKRPKDRHYGQLGGLNEQPYWCTPPEVEDERRYEAPVFIFAAKDHDVWQGSERVAVARSNTFAKRIANALNRYKPDQRGQ